MEIRASPPRGSSTCRIRDFDVAHSQRSRRRPGTREASGDHDGVRDAGLDPGDCSRSVKEDEEDAIVSTRPATTAERTPITNHQSPITNESPSQICNRQCSSGRMRMNKPCRQDFWKIVCSSQVLDRIEYSVNARDPQNRWLILTHLDRAFHLQTC